MQKVELDWGNIGFVYRKTDYRYIAYWKDGRWSPGQLVEDNLLTLSEGSTVFHYGQACFEGLKAQTARDGRVLLFRPDQNAQRMSRSAQAILMPALPEDLFVDACQQTVNANLRWVPPYGSGAALYVRPYMIGCGENLGLKPAPEYLFSVFVCPVGPYFKGGFTPVNFIVSDYDRAAPMGTGAYKVGGNYAASLKPQSIAKAAGYADCVFLDAKTNRYIEEIGSANFFGITHDNKFVTPKSPSILPSITKYSLMHIAAHDFGMTVEERPVAIDQLDEFTEAGACGTAAVITPIGGISYQGSLHTFYADGQEAGPVTTRLYERLTDIQRGEQEGPADWLVEVT
jgi:branched-chain amino acid aminotransferase